MLFWADAARQAGASIAESHRAFAPAKSLTRPR
jgi:hypothetical protein